MKIGVLAYRFNYYTNLQTILHKLPEATYVPVYDLYSLRRRAALKVNQIIGKPLIPTFNLNNQFEDYEFNKVDILHFSNGISYGRTPWVSSFETILPRFHQVINGLKAGAELYKPDEQTLRALEAMASPVCRGIIAWSACTAGIEKSFLNQIPQDLSAPIINKLKVLYPPREVIQEPRDGKTYSAEDPIRFIMVGAAFFRKGGRELFNAFTKLHAEGLPVKLVLVSSLRIENYAAQETEDDVVWAKRIIAGNPAWLEYYESLPNAQVLELMKAADVGLLPTWADSYGLSVLEAQACSLPVISTDIRALPEMNNDHVGWLIRVPKNELGEALYNTVEERVALSQAIETGLERAIQAICENPSTIAEKGKLAYEKILREHDPQVYANALRNIYAIS